MIKIYLPNISNKFYDNIRLIDDSNIAIYSGPSRNIYKTHANLMSGVYMFDSSEISSEIIQFSIEYSNLVKILIYHPKNKVNQDCLKYLRQVKHLVHDKINHNVNSNDTIHIPKFIINDKIYYNMNLNRVGRTVYFLDDDESIPPCIESKLYPNTKDRILMFNNPKLKHNQNLGIVSEQDKAKILNSSTHFICNDQLSYAAEAFACGIKLIDCESFEQHPVIDELKQSDIISYLQFIRNVIL